jgi:hypothetical protein
MITNTRTGGRVSPLWLIPIAPIFLVGFVFLTVANLTGMAVVTSVLDGFPAWHAGPDPAGIDQAFIREVLAVDHSLVGLVGLSSPWWVFIPGTAAGAAWEWMTSRSNAIPGRGADV